MADIPGDPSTTATVTEGSIAPGVVDTLGDHDWYKVTLGYGESITINVEGGGGLDPAVEVYDSTGATVLASNDDVLAGANDNSRVTFTPLQAGTYYIDVGASQDQSTGTYDLFVEPPSLNVWTYDQIANQLTNYFWGGDVHHWAVAQSGTLTVDIHTLTSAEQNVARTALSEWTDIIGVHFQEVTSGAQITFSDAKDSTGNSVAQTDATWANGIITSANVQISSDWVSDWSNLDSYGLQTYVHEIGHALGLGHPGNYNETGGYLNDALFANDSWSTSVMSYFSQQDNYYTNNQGFSKEYVLTPMIADILAMQQLYGLSSDTRTGDTTYGYNSNTDNPIFHASVYPNAAYTIFDSGGNDTLDFSGSPSNQLIDLNPQTFSNVNGLTGNLMIAPGVVIENAIGGGGNDTIIQNSANNVLSGGAGNDTLSYETATAGVTVNLSLTTAQNTGGAGTDTLSGFENLVGSAYNDTLTGGPTTVTISGGAGDDIIDAGTATPTARLTLSGGDGNDRFLIGTDTGPFVIDGGSGFNIVDGSDASGGLLLDTNYEALGGVDILGGIQEIIGSNYADTLIAPFAGAILIGGGGDDTLTGGDGTQLAGGTGNDTFIVSGNVQITENPGEGTDTVNAAGNYTLGTNFENLTLHEYLPWDPYAGASFTPAPSENWTAIGNDVANVITGNLSDNVITGLGGADTLTGGGGNDTFTDTKIDLNGDTITDFSASDKIVFTDAVLSTFGFSLVGNTLTYNGFSLTLSNVPPGTFVASAAAGGGVELTLTSNVPVQPAHDDFTGDGLSDVLWRNDNGSVVTFLGASNGSFVGNVNFNLNPGLDWHIAGSGDFNGDGRVDILWRNDNGDVVDLLGNADGSFTGNVDFNLNPGLDWHIEGTGDFNGDGRSDILWRNDNGTVVTLLGAPNGSFVGNVNFTLNPGLDWHIEGTGDFNGDGLDDILWRNDAGKVVTLLGAPNGSFIGNVNFDLNPGLDWHVVGTGDFNGDGRDDLLWRNDAGTMTDLLGNPDGSFTGNVTNFAVNPGTEWSVVSIGDFNGDGIDDLLLRNTSGNTIDWLGQTNGAFTDNSATFNVNPGTDWHVQDPFVHDPFGA